MVDNKENELKKKKSEGKAGVSMGTIFIAIGVLLFVTGTEQVLYKLFAFGFLIFGALALAGGIITYKEGKKKVMA